MSRGFVRTALVIVAFAALRGFMRNVVQPSMAKESAAATSSTILVPRTFPKLTIDTSAHAWTTPPPIPPQWVVGSCVNSSPSPSAPIDAVIPVACESPHTGKITAEAAGVDLCPWDAEGGVEHTAGVVLCIDEDL